MSVGKGNVMLDTMHRSRPSIEPLEALKRNCQEIASASNDAQKIGALLSEMIVHYYEDVRRQALQSFYCALGAAVVGTGFFVYAASQYMDGSEQAYLAFLAGVLIQVISGTIFYLYSRTARQFAAFHICLERTNRFLLANAMSQSVVDEAKRDTLREELVRIVANASMLSLDLIEGKPGASQGTTA